MPIPTDITPHRRLLVATDFSAPARAALDWAVEHARAVSGAITLVHVLPATRSELPPAIAGEVRERLETLAAGPGGRPPIEIRWDVGRPWEVVPAIAAEIEADLVVLGRRGQSSHARLRLGSTTDRIVRLATTPVLTVPDTERPERGPVVVGTDFSPEADAALREARRLLGQSAGPARLVLVHACDFPVEYGIASGVEFVSHAREEEAAEARARLDRMAADLRGADLAVEVSVREGDAAAVIEERAAEEGARLVAVGTHGRSGLGRLMLGSVAERVLHHAACPVLTVHAPTAAAPRDRARAEEAR